MFKGVETINPEKRYEQPRGLDVHINSYFFRHAEKNSGIIGTAKEGGSLSSISSQGEKDSRELGTTLDQPAKDGFKIKWSGNPRSLETGEALIEGYFNNLNKHEFRTKFATRKRTELYGEPMPRDFLALYMVEFEESLRKILKRENLTMEEYKILDSGKQAELAEEAEEPVMREWINNENGQLQKSHSLEQAAAPIALMVNRDLKMSQELNSGSQVDNFNMIHKISTEPFLMKVIVLESGQKPEKLEDIGGSLGLNDGWKADIATDGKGERTAKIVLYRVNRSQPNLSFETQEYSLDIAELERLAMLEMERRKYKDNTEEIKGEVYEKGTEETIGSENLEYK